MKALVTDVGSTKRLICERARETLGDDLLFLGGHPLAGKERAGVENADAALFTNARYVLTPLEEGHLEDTRIQAFVSLVTAIGARPHIMDPARHDRATPTAEAVFYGQLLEGIRGLPGVVAAGASGEVPLKAGQGYWFFDVGGKPTGEAQIFHVSGDYFRAMGIPLLAGRCFTPREVQDESKKVIIISRSLARGVWGEKNPVGEQLKVEGGNGEVPREVVGVAGDVTFPGESEPRGWEHWQFYFPGGPTTTLVVRTASDLNTLINPLRNQILAFDKNLTAFNVETMDEVHSEFTAPPRFRSLLLGLFATLAFVLAVLGLYGVVSYTVACQTHEIGVRMSMGADPGDILRLVLRRGARLALWGVGVGLAGALGWNRLISSFLFGVGPTDPATFAEAALLLIGGALLACSIPALRASKVQPMVALRHE